MLNVPMFRRDLKKIMRKHDIKVDFVKHGKKSTLFPHERRIRILKDHPEQILHEVSHLLLIERYMRLGKRLPEHIDEITVEVLQQFISHPSYEGDFQMCLACAAVWWTKARTQYSSHASLQESEVTLVYNVMQWLLNENIIQEIIDAQNKNA